VSDWWAGDYTQNRRIRELRDDLADAQFAASRQSSALRRELSSLRGNLEAKIDRLAVAFDHFVELSDLREELATYATEAMVRRRARHLVLGLAERASDPSIPPPPALAIDDVPSYWLVPAIEALAALVREDTAAVDRAAAEAAARDRHRTAVFLTLGLTVAGEPTRATPWIEDAFAALGASTTSLQRQLWRQGLAGSYGKTGREVVVRRIDDFVTALDPEQVRAMAEPWRQALPAFDPTLLPDGLRGTIDATRKARGSRTAPALAVPRHAVAQLDALAELCTAALTTTATSDGDSGTALVQPAPPTNSTGPVELVRSLIDEGHGDEAPLLRRAAELHRAIEDGAEAPVRWDAAQGDTVTILNSDAHGDDPQRRAVAVRACARVVMHVADELTAASNAPLPDHVVVKVHGVDIKVVPGQPDMAALDAAHGRIDRYRPDRQTRAQAIATVVGGVVLVGIGAAAVNWFALVAGLALIAGAVVLWRRDAAERAQDAARLAADQAALTQRVRTIADALVGYRATVEIDRETATSSRAKLAGLFT